MFDKNNMHMHDQARYICLIEGGDTKWEAKDQHLYYGLGASVIEYVLHISYDS